MPNLPDLRSRPRPVRRPLAGALLAATLLLVLAGVPALASAEVEGFSGSQLEQSLSFQYELGSDVGFVNAPLIGTHNSFNSQQEMGSGLAPVEANQTADLTDQLDFGVRSLELDLHRDPDGDERPIVCHSLPRKGCTAVTDLAALLAEVRDWLARPANANQVILVYLQDDLDDLALHDSAAATIDAELGNRIFAPVPEQGCQEVDGDLTRDEVRAAGKQVVIVSGCGEGPAWRSVAFSWNDDHLEARPRGFEKPPSCGPDFRRRQYQTTLIRYFEDSTRPLGSATADDGIGPLTTSAMVRCGVDLLSFDRLEPLDGRLEASIWSWAPEQPSQGRCALIRAGRRQPSGRWRSVRCDSVRARPVCRERGRWRVGGRTLPPQRARRYCRRRGSVAAVPRTGYENQLVRSAMEQRGARSALLGIRRRGGIWVPLDPRG